MSIGGSVDVHEFAASVRSQPEEENAIAEAALLPSEVQSLNQVVSLLNSRRVPKQRVRELMSAMAVCEGTRDDSIEDEAYDQTFDMEKEVSEVLRAVKLLRRSIMTENGKSLKQGVTVGEAKDVISMSNSMINTLMKSHEKIVNMARYRAVEQATIDVLRDLDGDMQLMEDMEKFVEGGKSGDGPLVKAFMTSLESRLDN